MMTIFVTKKFIRTGNYLLLLHESRPSHLSLLNGRMMALQKMIDKKNTYRLFSPFFPVLTRRGKLCLWRLDDCPVSNKICKITTNHSHLLGAVMTENLSH